MTFRTIATEAAQEIGIIASGETLSPDDANVVLGKIRRLLNNWNADRRAVYATAFSTYTFVPNLSPHTIGPTGTWTATIRPVTVDGAQLVVSNGTANPVYLQIKMRDAQWWLAQSVPTITTTVPTDCYYQPDWPNGSLYFWPVPSAARDVQLMIRVLLNDVPDLDTTFTLPPGYHDAVVLSTAEACSGKLFGVALTPELQLSASTARSRVFDNNDSDPRLKTQDSGLGSISGRKSDFNFWSGQVI